MNRTRSDLANEPRPALTSVRIDHVNFESLSPNEWRIVDARHPKGSVEALVGFVARHDGAYYATRLRHPLESVPFGSLEAVAAFLVRGA